MKNILKILPLLFLLPTDTSAQMTVTPGNSPAGVQSLTDDGITISNININCDAQAMGTFLAGTNPFGLKKGVILTTGFAANAGGHPQNGNSRRDIYGRFPQRQPDADLAREINRPVSETDDACAVSFDITSATDKIIFQYVMGSEEYTEWVGSGYNDAFAFLVVSGPGYAPNTNVALIPGTSLRVSVATISSQQNAHLYRDNDGCKSAGCFEYDGFTVPLEAVINAVSGAKYRVKWVIADVEDERYDSGVFIQKILSENTPFSLINPPELKLKSSGGTVRAEVICHTSGNMILQRAVKNVFSDVADLIFEDLEGLSCEKNTFIDRLPLPGSYYYRLKYTDKDTLYHFSRIHEVKTGFDPEEIFWTENTLTFTSEHPCEVTLTDLSGRTFFRQFSLPDSDGTIRVRLPELKAGCYVMKTDSGKIMRKCILE